MSFQDYFAGKKITAMGLGVLGRGVGDIAYMAEAGAAEIIVTDLKTEEQLRESVEKLRTYKNVTFTLGGHRHEDFGGRDLVLVSAGVPLDSEYLNTARSHGCRLVQSAALFAELSRIPLIGVTGTRGKSTVTNMIHHVLEVATGEPVILGGNIRGVSNLQLLNSVQEDSLAVFELDSWQLQGFGWAEISPQIAVFITFMEDHLNYYQAGGKTKEAAMELYFADKANIFRYQEESGVLVTTPEVFARAKSLPGISLGQEVVLVDGSELPEDILLATPGEHNRLNAALATAALRATGLSDEEIFDGLASFPGVEGRLQYVKEVAGVKIYNDNNATEPNATIAGLAALGQPEHKNIVLIAGGADKGVALEPLIDSIKKYCKAVFLIPGSGTDRLSALLAEADGSFHVEQVENLFGAVAAARSAAATGDTILFSPAFASFGQYNNEYERNDEFMTIVSKL